MAGSSLLTLLDDIAAILDDVSLLTGAAIKKTIPVIGDDLALNAQQVMQGEVSAQRELPIVWAVAKGSIVNKLVLIPIAFVLSSWAAWSIHYVMMLGGAYLCFEGAEKVHAMWQKVLHTKKNTSHPSEVDPHPQLSEKQKIRGAIRTDFVLSAEIIVISLGALTRTPLLQRAVALVCVALFMSIAVYGMVAIIVKMDDFGWYLCTKKSPFFIRFGRCLLWCAPRAMKALSLLGTLAMFWVGGGIFLHNVHFLYSLVMGLTETFSTHWKITFSACIQLVLGIVLGVVCILVWKCVVSIISHISNKKANS